MTLQVGEDAHLVVRRAVRALTEGDTAARDEALDLLEYVLPVHFAEEEAPGGFLDQLAKRVDHPLEVVALREQHAQLLVELVACRGDEARIAKFAAALADHEWTESKLAAQPSLFSPEAGAR